jgi:hypothetical protein
MCLFMQSISKDIIFVVDRSTKMMTPEVNYLDLVNGALQKFVNDIDPSNDGAKVSVVTYDRIGFRLIELDTNQKARDIKQKLQSKLKVSPFSEQNLGEGLTKVLEIAEQIKSGGFRNLFFDFNQTPRIPTDSANQPGSARPKKTKLGCTRIFLEKNY